MFRELLKICEEKQKKGNIYIQTHNCPDPDAVASAYGLQQLLKSCGIDTAICYEGAIDKVNIAMMIELFNIEMTEYSSLKDSLSERRDSIICVDSQKGGGNITDFIGEEIACIDHHPVCSDEQYLYRDIRKAGACASLITGYFSEMGIAPDSKTATALLYGIKMDTNHFARGVTDLDVDMFKLLFPLADNSALNVLEHSQMKYDDLKAYGAAIEGIQIISGCGFSYIPFSCLDGMIATLADFILSLNEVKVAVICSEREDGIKISIRSELTELDAGKMVKKALEGIGSGGGHPTMAGGIIPAENKEKLGERPDETIINAIRENLKF